MVGLEMVPDFLCNVLLFVQVMIGKLKMTCTPLGDCMDGVELVKAGKIGSCVVTVSRRPAVQMFQFSTFHVMLHLEH